MKRCLSFVLLMAGLGGMQGGAQVAAPAQEPAPMAGRMPSPDRVMELMTTKLGLTDDQRRRIEPIVAGRQQEMQAILADTSSRPMQKQRKAKALKEDSDKKINAILTPDQQKQYAALEEQMKEAMKERRQEQKGAGK